MTKKSSKKAVLPPGPVMVDVAGFTLTKEEKSACATRWWAA